MGEELGGAGDGVRAVQRALRAVHQFDVVDVVERGVGKIKEAAGLVDRRSVDEEFGEVGVAAIKKESGESAFPARASDGSAGASSERVGKRDELALIDFGAGDDIHGRGSLADLKRMRIGGDGYGFGELGGFEAHVEVAGARNGGAQS